MARYVTPLYQFNLMLVDEASHSDLITQLQRGCPVAFDRLYAQYSRELIRSVFYQVSDIEVAKDIIQEVFLMLWRKRATAGRYNSVKIFLYKVARDLIIDHYRKAAGYKKMTDRVLLYAVDFHSHSEDALHYKETKAMIDDAISTLTPHQQVIYRKSRLEGRGHEEIAEELGISKSTVNNQIVKANKKVVAFLERYDTVGVVVLSFLFFKS
jgi:RNA polymerase sigma factor (sigma-70 family)